MKKLLLNNKVKIPILGLGTYKLSNEDVSLNIIDALSVGYRHIDTATFYHNEEGIGDALQKTAIPREELFITTKVWPDDQGYEKTKEAFMTSLKKLKIDYIDLYLIHWPDAKSVDAWRAMEELYEAGLIKAIGVSNFNQEQLHYLMDNCKIKPMVNQLERHPYFRQEAIKTYCDEHNIITQAWSPLGRGVMFEDPVLIALREKYEKTVPQIILKWHTQSNWISIPKSSNIIRMQENISIFDFDLSKEDMESINALDKDMRTGGNPSDYTFKL